MTKKTTKLCPYLIVTEERKAICVGNNDMIVTYFNPCLKEICMGYVNGECGRLNESKNESCITSKDFEDAVEQVSETNYSIIDKELKK